MLLKRTIMLPFLLVTIGASAQLQAGKKNIEKLCGCFDVEFKYAETFSPDKNYKFHDRENLGGTELVLPVETSDKKVVLQHILVIDDTTFVKHWREDWTFEQGSLLQYQGNKQWTKAGIGAGDAANKWVQTVWEVDDAPRYQGIGQWVNTDGKTFWQSTVDAPLPRREYTTRNDYNILKRGNRILVSDSGWVHEQDNQKIVRSGNASQLIAEEKGINNYHRVDITRCAKAKAWWEANNAFWKLVRTEWDNYIGTHTNVALQNKIDNKRLTEHFGALAKEFTENKISKDELSARLKKVIRQFSESQATATIGR